MQRWPWKANPAPPSTNNPHPPFRRPPASCGRAPFASPAPFHPPAGCLPLPLRRPARPLLPAPPCTNNPHPPFRHPPASAAGRLSHPRRLPAAPAPPLCTPLLPAPPSASNPTRPFFGARPHPRPGAFRIPAGCLPPAFVVEYLQTAPSGARGRAPPGLRGRPQAAPVPRACGTGARPRPTPCTKETSHAPFPHRPHPHRQNHRRG